MSHGQNLQRPLSQEGLNCMSERAKPCGTIKTPPKTDNFNISTKAKQEVSAVPHTYTHILYIYSIIHRPEIE